MYITGTENKSLPPKNKPGAGRRKLTSFSQAPDIESQQVKSQVSLKSC